MQVLLVGSIADDVSALYRTLEDLGLDWQLVCVGDASSALALMATREIDVVVASSRNATASVALFERIRERHPRVARLMLLESGHDSLSVQAMDSTHRFLNWPLRGDELVAAVESIVELRELFESERLRTLVGQVSSLPPPPKLYSELRRQLAREDDGPDAIAKLISSDPAIAAKVLRLCNSAYFGGGRTITDVRSAVIRLGTETLRRVVLASEVYSGVPLRSDIDREAMRDRALRSSQLAAQLLEGSSADLAATASLLAEVGLLLPGVPLPGQAAAGEPTYAEAGAYLLGLWGLPLPIVEGVANHVNPERSGTRSFWVTGAVHVSRALAAGAPVNEDYLASVSKLDRLSHWRRKAADFAA